MTTHPTQDDATFGDTFARRRNRATAAPVATREDATDPWQARRALIAEKQAERDHDEQEAAAAERARVDALPVTDPEIDADPAVAELERRIADGDTSVTAAQLAKERTAAEGRARHGRLRGWFADRAARKDAEQLELEQAEAAEQHARDALAAHSPAVLVERYDAAVDALRALAATLDARNATVLDLVRLPPAERVRGAELDPGMQEGGPRLPLDGMVHRPQLPGEVITRALRAARIVPTRSGAGLRVVGEDEHFDTGGTDPVLIAECRAQLEARLGDDAA